MRPGCSVFWAMGFFAARVVVTFGRSWDAGLPADDGAGAAAGVVAALTCSGGAQPAMARAVDSAVTVRRLDVRKEMLMVRVSRMGRNGAVVGADRIGRIEGRRRRRL